MSRRIFLSHLLTLSVACLVLAGVFNLVSPEFYRQQLDSVALLVTPEWVWLRVSLEHGQRRTVLLSLLVSLPISALFAAGTAYAETRRIASAVEKLAKGSREIARGRYGERLEIRGDELGALALHFNQMAAALQEADENRHQLVRAVVHEVRTPLSNLRGYAEALEDGVMTQGEVVEVISREVSLLRRVTDDLSLVTQIEAGSALQLRPERPQDLIMDAYERFIHAFEDNGITLQIDAADALPSVSADRERVGQVLGNLLANALLYAPGGERVTLGAHSAAADEVQFFVSDEGPGVPHEQQPHLFRRFYRADAHEQGMGIGLTVAKGLVEAMGGSIGVASEPGRGSTFFFTLRKAKSVEG